ncbi:hypothetical protein IWW37_003901 [Coemansia sp. RSA 2050]|nr:hypothetical protein IWW37_003901 [Coemansia sp. RSA 2050]KAJ2732160.1 hypothetical protein IW152_004020 [Coemansia sp. BCRC 34962]
MTERGNPEDRGAGLYIYARPLVPTDSTYSDMTDSDSDSDSDYMEVDDDDENRDLQRGTSQEAHNSSSDSEGAKQQQQPHHWRRRAPLLPQRMATLVSQVSGATRLSLEITALFWEAIFDSVTESTNSGIWLGTAAWEEVRSLGLAAASVLSPLSSLNPRIVSRLVSSTTAAGYSVVNQSLAAAESLLEGGFTLYTGAVNTGLHIAGEYVRLIDALFGSTDTSRVLASFMHMCRREAFEKNPEIKALVDEHGVVGFGSQVLKTVVAWICLQVVTHGRSRPYRMELACSNVQTGPVFCPRKFIDSSGKPLPAKSAASLRIPADTRTPATPMGVSPVADHAREGSIVQPAISSEDEEYHALSDQEGSLRLDPDWDQQLMEALRKESLRNERRQKQPECAKDSVAHDAHRNRSSLWSMLLMVRESAATTAAAQEHGTTDTSPSDSDQGPPVPRGISMPFDSAPASLTSSPQFPATPGIDAGRIQRSYTTALEEIHGESMLPLGDIPMLDGLPPSMGSQWMQEFPRKPLLFNLARFISVASSAYGHNFMQVLGLGHGMIDARALIDEFGDYEVNRLSQSNSVLSMDLAASPGPTNKLPRAQPMSTYHTHSTYNPSRPESQRLYERRHFRAASPRASGHRRAPVRRHRKRRQLSEHPNHRCFSQHTGIPLGDLLFSSYVPPIVPGVTKAASAQASAVERKLRNKKKKRHNEGEPETEPTPAPIDIAKKGVWLSSIPIVGGIYQRLPSPMAVLSAVPVIPGLVSRVLGTAETSGPQPRPKPTPGQVRRFDKLRQRLVYRNPSIHALVHYIAVDHATRSVVLACRGTLGISDLFIDMICEYETIHLADHPSTNQGCDFRVHSGMWHSALLLADQSSEVFKEVAEALRLYPEYGLVVTGHSLGGGVASLLTLLWSQPMFAHTPPSSTQPAPGSACGSPRQFATSDKFGLVTQRPIHCFSFGSPCSTNAALSYYCRGLVTSVANANDVVSFLSIGTCVDILNISAVLGRERGVAEKVVRKFLATQRSKIGKKLNIFDFDFFKLRAHNDSDDEDAEKRAESPLPKRRKQSNLDDWHWSLVKTLRANMDSEKLYPPGDVFILAAPGDDEMAPLQSSDDSPGTDHLPVGLFYCPDVAERFSELRFARNMFAHHLPSTYERRLAALVHETRQANPTASK